MKIIRVGLVGCGRNSDTHLRVYAKTEGVKLVAVCDVDPAKAREKAERYGAEQALSDYDKLLRLNLDLVDIVTPTATHAKLSILALESSHNVLVEKPMAVSSKDCLAMIKAANKSGRMLSVVHNKQFYRSITDTKAIIQREGLTVSKIRLSHFFTQPHSGIRPDWMLTRDSGGILWESLVHPIYLIQHFIGPVTSVYASARKHKQSMHNSFTINLESAQSMGIAEYEWDVKEPLSTFQLITEQGDRFDGDLLHDFVLRKSRKYRNRPVVALRSFSDDLYGPLVKWSGHLRNFLAMRSYPGGLPYEITFFTLIRRMLDFLRGIQSSPLVTAEEGLQTIRVLEAVRDSIASGVAQSL